MSIKIEIIGDTIPEIVACLREHLEIFSSVSVVAIDKDDTSSHVQLVEAAPVTATPPTPAASSFADGAASTPRLLITEIIDMLTTAYKNGDAETRERIVQARDAAGLKYLSQAKDEHTPALLIVARELGLL